MGPVAAWAAKKAAKKFLGSKTGQKWQGQVHGAVTGAIRQGHKALSQHQFPDSPPWDAPSTPPTRAGSIATPSTPDFPDIPPAKKHDEPPW
jgi:hypothetical protein